MTNQDALRAILSDMEKSWRLHPKEAKELACGLLMVSPLVMDKYLTKLPSGRMINDRYLELLRVKWILEKWKVQLPE